MGPEIIVSSIPFGLRGTLIRLQGELDLETTIDVESAVKHHLTSERPQVILDALAVRTVDSIGLAMVLRISRRARRLGGHMSIVCNPGPVLRILEITGLNHVIPVFTDVSAALANSEQAAV